jgi:sugar O-acyltransferase (sialic acid O-acetyltransferase NeuD family)
LRGFLDDIKPAGTKHGGTIVLGDTDSTLDPSATYILALGKPEHRMALAQKFSKKAARFVSIIHPQSYVAATARVGNGSIVTPFAFIGPETNIGEHNLFNVHSSVGHEAVTGHGCVLSPYAGLHGAAHLGTGVFLGNSACITAKIKVGDHVNVSAGAVVYKDIPAGAWALGNPALFKMQT